jgi:hypothetical protein
MRLAQCRILPQPNDYYMTTEEQGNNTRLHSDHIGEVNMQYFVYDPNYDPEAAAPPPSPELLAEMGKFIEEATQAGVLVATGALQPKGTRLKLSNGKFTVTDGPFIELKELLGGWAVLQVKSLEEAIEWSKRFRKIVGDGESEIVPILGPQ